MGSKATNQQQGSHERELLRTGQQRTDLGRQIAAKPTQYINETSTKDYSKLYRGRLNADAAQALSGNSAASYAMAASDPRGLGSIARVDNAQTKARGAALSEGTKRGTAGRDQNIFSAMDVSMGKQAGTSRNMSQLARTQANEIATQAKIAADETNAKRSALTALGTAAVGKYRQGKMDDMRAMQDADYDRYKQNAFDAGDEPVSFAKWSRGNSLERQYGLGWGGKFFNSLGGAG